VKPGYWVISDSVSGEGEHEVAARFPFLPGKLTFDESTGICHTNNAGGNLLVVPCSKSEFAPAVYEYRVPGGKSTVMAPGLKYSIKSSLPVSNTVVLYPYKGEKAPSVPVEKIGTDAYLISAPEGKDIVSFGSFNSVNASFDGESVVIRTSGDKIKSAAWVNGTSVSYRGKKIAASDKPVKGLELVYDGDTLTINTSSREPSLKVAALGARFVRVGTGERQKITGDVVEPFRN
jgi:hypothetical protein